MPSPRTISVPGWDDIEANYSRRTRSSLDGLMRAFEPAHGGQLILWHGKAGTGKTFALRALAWEWRRWAQFHYIVDPDSFFGEHADYLMSVLMQPAELTMMDDGFEDDIDLDGPEVARARGTDERLAGKAWRVLVLEDTGELLTPDAKAIIGQGLSRFLNVVDGLIGQGLRVLVLVTTNEEVRALHPAVARPGRCAANIEFTPLTADEASSWLDAHGIEEGTEHPSILASLYATVEGFDVGAATRRTGFAG